MGRYGGERFLSKISLPYHAEGDSLETSDRTHPRADAPPRVARRRMA